ncbi:DUF4352 domain-containing protein [Streptomyces candidus]|uniref:DUF4352 domain-containing protein n=1 Tax=Streptomyces candidus TaxID=67283 RepID=A0A7X0LQ93_9ACTN|nr:DUF4352 domain-containing protein [Streptomyces candidus]MBB6436797.1 hypothetical protein [Streptomyces candidus]GHH51442.1 hypothetical protein GCM10018773_50080 [Streptomyces candidus]
MQGSDVPQWQQPPVPPRRKSWFSRHKIMTAVLAIVGIVVVIVVASTGGGGGSEEAVKPTPTISGSSETSENASKTPKEGPGLGDPVRDGKFEFTVIKIEDGVRNIGGSDFGQEAQGQFILVHVKVENIGEEAQTFDGGSQKLIDSDGKEYSADTSAGIYLDDSKSFLEQINPGNSVTGVIVYDVPKSVKPQSIELHDAFMSGGTSVELR